MGVKMSAVGTLAVPPRPWQQALVLELDCPTKTVPPKGLPDPSPVSVTVFCTPKAWRSVQAEAEQGARLLAEGEACLDVPRGVAQGDLVMVALRLMLLPAKGDSPPAADKDPAPAKPKAATVPTAKSAVTSATVAKPPTSDKGLAPIKPKAPTAKQPATGKDPGSSEPKATGAPAHNPSAGGKGHGPARTAVASTPTLKLPAAARTGLVPAKSKAASAPVSKTTPPPARLVSVPLQTAVVPPGASGPRRRRFVPPELATGYIPAPIRLAVWEAEDGFCEACGRALDLPCAFFAQVQRRPRVLTADNLHLLCPDCKTRRPDPLYATRISWPVASALATRLGEGPDAAATWLLDQLRHHAILAGVHKGSRDYRLPGAGTLLLQSPHAVPVVSVAQWDAPEGVPQVQARPQVRTRGLPRPLRQPTSAVANG